MASREHGREGRPGAKPDPGAGSSGIPNKDKSFLESLRDSKGDDWGLSSASRRLRELRSKSGQRSSSSAQAGPQPRKAPAPRKSERTFEVLDQPLPSERARQSDTLETPRVPGAPQRTPPAGARPLGAPPRPTEERRREAKRTRRRARPPRTRPVRGAVRRVKRTVKRVDPWSVLKMSLFFYSIFFVVWMIGVAMLFSFIESAGVFELIDEIRQGFVIEELESFEISMGVVMRWAAYVGGALVLLATIVNVILAFLYNLGSDIVGGVEMTFVERDE